MRFRRAAMAVRRKRIFVSVRAAGTDGLEYANNLHLRKRDYIII